MYKCFISTGQAGYPASKLLHYGPVEAAVTYLSRRLVENKSGLETAEKERNMLSTELKRRMKAKVMKASG